MLPVRDQSSNTGKRRARPDTHQEKASRSHTQHDLIIHSSHGDEHSRPTHSRAQYDPIFQTLLEVWANGEASESLNPASELRLLLRVIFGLQLEG